MNREARWRSPADVDKTPSFGSLTGARVSPGTRLAESDDSVEPGDAETVGSGVSNPPRPTVDGEGVSCEVVGSSSAGAGVGIRS